MKQITCSREVISFFQILTLYDSLDSVNVDMVVEFIQNLQQEDGSFFGDKWGMKNLVFKKKYQIHVIQCKVARFKTSQIFSKMSVILSSLHRSEETV